MATEKRLIDANALMNSRPEYRNQNDVINSDFNCGWNACNGEYWKLIKESPTVDAVPVIRCKNCIRYNTSGCADGFGWCEAFDYGRMDNDYCSFGTKTDEVKCSNLLFADMEEIIDATD